MYCSRVQQQNTYWSLIVHVAPKPPRHLLVHWTLPHVYFMESAISRLAVGWCSGWCSVLLGSPMPHLINATTAHSPKIPSNLKQSIGCTNRYKITLARKINSCVKSISEMLKLIYSDIYWYQTDTKLSLLLITGLSGALQPRWLCTQRIMYTYKYVWACYIFCC